MSKYFDTRVLSASPIFSQLLGPGVMRTPEYYLSCYEPQSPADAGIFRVTRKLCNAQCNNVTRITLSCDVNFRLFHLNQATMTGHS